jgi:tetratricopeptide (TPR) repeat protein
MDSDTRRRAIELRKKIIAKRSGDAEKLARSKELTPRQIRNRTTSLLESVSITERPIVTFREPTESDLFSREEWICRELLVEGYVCAFEDFFKTTHQKMPGAWHCEFWQKFDEDTSVALPPTVPQEDLDFLKEQLIAAEVAKRHGNDEDLAAAYLSISQYFQTLGDLKVAIIFLEKLRDYAIFTSDLARESHALKEIGRLLKTAGDLKTSLRYCEECLNVSSSVGCGVSDAQAALVQAYRDYSDFLIQKSKGEDAIEFLTKSLKVAEESGVPLTTAVCHQELGNCLKRLGQIDVAIHHFERAFKICEGIGAIEGQSMAVSALATSLKYLGRVQEAVEYFKILHDLANQTGNAEDKAVACLTMGKILWDSDQKEQALVWFEKNFDISVGLEDLDVIEDSRVSLGVSIANYRMQRFSEIIKDKGKREELLRWELRRSTDGFQSSSRRRG